MIIGGARFLVVGLGDRPDRRVPRERRVLLQPPFDPGGEIVGRWDRALAEFGQHVVDPVLHQCLLAHSGISIRKRASSGTTFVMPWSASLRSIQATSSSEAKAFSSTRSLQQELDLLLGRAVLAQVRRRRLPGA